MELNRVRVVHLCSSGGVGGMETSVLAMLEGLRAAVPTWPIAVVAPDPGKLLERAGRLGCEAVALPYPGPLARFGEASASAGLAARAGAAPAAVFYGGRLRRMLEQFRPDIVHAHGIKMQVLSRWSSPPGARLVWHVHEYLCGREFSVRALRSAAGRCAVAVASSRSAADDFRAFTRADCPVAVIYNAVDTHRFAPDGRRLDLDALAEMPAARPGTIRIGLPGLFGRWKGHDVFLRALTRLPAGLDWRAYIVGAAVYQTTGSQRSLDALQREARDLHLGDRVGFTGLVEDMPSALRSLDIVVHASTRPEPFGMTIIEAMACGRVVVVPLAGGAAEIVHEGVDAVGYAPAEPASLAAVLGDLMADPARRASLAAAARRWATAAFDARRLGPELRQVYDSVLCGN